MFFLSAAHCVFDVFGQYSASDFRRQLPGKGIYVSTVPKRATLAGEALARLGLHRRRRLVAVKSRRADLEALAGWIDDGRVRPVIEKVYPIEQAAAAHRHIETKHTRGKIVLSLAAV